MPRIALVVVTDGRPCLTETLRSAAELLPIDGPTFLVNDAQHKLGLSGAVCEGWRQAARSNVDWVFHLEDDFVFDRPVPVDEMIGLCYGARLAQVALKRGPVNLEEAQAGGFMELNPANYVQREGWVESFFGFTLNPCVVPRSVFEGRMFTNGERGLTDQLVGGRFGIFGTIDDPPRCEHIGVQRSAGWTL